MRKKLLSISLMLMMVLSLCMATGITVSATPSTYTVTYDGSSWTGDLTVDYKKGDTLNIVINVGGELLNSTTVVTNGMSALYFSNDTASHTFSNSYCTVSAEGDTLTIVDKPIFIEYDTNGGSPTYPIDGTTSYSVGDSVSLKSTSGITRDGYKCLGWALENDATAALESYSVNKNDATMKKIEDVDFPVITLYAVWEEKVSAKIGDVEYPSITAALAAEKPVDESKSNPTVIKLVDDIEENVVIPAKRYITLDLNGHVLSAPSTGGTVITNNGTLTISDSDKTTQHYFKATVDTELQNKMDELNRCSDACLWVLDNEAVSGTAYDELTETPEAGEIIAISGGVITGGTGTYNSSKKTVCGGGILSDGELTLDTVTVCGNTLEYKSDTAVRFYGAGVYISEDGSCSTKGNTMLCGNSYWGFRGFGAGIYSLGNLTINKGSSISFNSINEEGGGIYIEEKNATIIDCEIKNNIVRANGGGVYFDGYYATNQTIFSLTMEDCEISGNTVIVGAGGGVCCSDGTVSIKNGEIADNEAGDGGGISWETNCNEPQNSMSLCGDEGVSISGNKASEEGGGVYIGGIGFSAVNCEISDNEANTSGGGIYDDGGADISLTDCKITNNEAKDASGGGVHIATIKTSCAYITGGTVSKNKAANGGGIYVDYAEFGDALYGKAVMTNVTVSENKASANGGGIHVSQGAELLAKGCKIKNNEAVNGGGIYKSGGISDDAETAYGKCVLLNTQISENSATGHGGGVYYQYFKGCFAAGTQITMADGSTKAIEDIAKGDQVKTFDHENGAVSSAEVYLAFEGETEATPFTLTFEGGTSLSIVDCHDLLEKSSLKYVTITEDNAKSYIGKSFYGEDGQWHKLTAVNVETESCKYYSIYTEAQQNCFANGMLSVPDDMDFIPNIYELDENLKADEEQLKADITNYGLVSYEMLSLRADISREFYESFCGKYLLVAIGKGLTTEEYLEKTYNETMGNAESKTEVKAVIENSGIFTSALSTLSSMFVTTVYAEETPSLDDFDCGVLTIGSGTKIHNNTANSKTENVYLIDGGSEHTLITLYGENRSGINVGITTATAPTAEAPVQFTTNGTSADLAYFFSDNTAYTDRYNAGSGEGAYLELAVPSEDSSELDDEDNSGTKTGDSNNLMPYLIIFALALLVILAFLYVRVRKQKK